MNKYNQKNLQLINNQLIINLYELLIFISKILKEYLVISTDLLIWKNLWDMQ